MGKKFGRVLGLGILVIAIGLAAYVVYYLDQSPRTDDAFVRADTIGVAPQVSGRIVQLRVHDNQSVKQGDVLFEIDPVPYQHALERARAALDSLEKQIVLTSRDVRAQQFNAAAAHANIERADAQAKQAADTLGRIEPLLAKEYVTAEQVDQARTAKRSADAALQVARRDAERAAAAVSGVDALVARLGELRAAVATAEYDLSQTVMRAPFDGRVINLDIAQGEFAATGRPLFTLIDTQNWYVIANFRETALKGIRPGMKAEVYLMSDPRRRFSGTVHSIGFGVFPEEGGASSNGLPKVPRDINWVRVAQRFPVRIRVDAPPADLFRIGASAVALVPPAGS
jgi:membrane fusion protein, multidrug efflux system